MTIMRRYWFLLLIVTGLLAVAVAYFGVDWYTREAPNYSKIEDGVWLGGRVAEPPPGTQAVLNLCEADDGYRVESHRWEPIHDTEPAPTLDWLRSQVAFIESERAAGHTVYVHCMNGASRSAMVTSAYFMKREGWSRDRTLVFLRERRDAVRPNPAFMDLLAEWESALKTNQ